VFVDASQDKIGRKLIAVLYQSVIYDIRPIFDERREVDIMLNKREGGLK
jgi:hypothetical protein